MKKKIIGYAPVDSGQLIVVDPCYLSDWYDPTHYKQACNATMTADLGGEILVKDKAGNGVAFSTGWGDGNYPVEATYNEEGRIMKITIDFN